MPESERRRPVLRREPTQHEPQPHRLKQAWEPGQLDGERSRLALDGRRTDDNTPCKFLLIHQHGGGWTLYPHGMTVFGVTLCRTDALSVARRIIDEAE